MSDDELSAIGLFKTLRGKDEKFFPTDETLALRYQEKSKPSAATAKPKTTMRSAKSKFYDGDLAALPVKGELSLSSLFGSIPNEYKATHKAGFNQGSIKKDTAIPYIEAYRQTHT